MNVTRRKQLKATPRSEAATVLCSRAGMFRYDRCSKPNRNGIG